MSSNNFQNKLINSSSPYLLQHAGNPVNWFPWGDEAFEKAKKEDKPVFLSIGYSTCHWCHVMAHESFEDEEIAGLMNEAFINVKVDREERPDIDNTYMLVCQMLTGSGGWPLNVWLTPHKKPFYAATYIPKTGRHGQPGLRTLIPRISEFWQNEREQVEKSTDEIAEAFQKSVKLESGDYLGTDILDEAYRQYTSRFDNEYGGFGSAPKFPSPHNLMLLLRHAKQNKDSNALPMFEKTLTQMRLGGLFDHIGFGFHRYSTDQKWLVPHFEKMLYDQAMLLMAYTEAWLFTKNELFKQTAEEIFEYLNRKMHDENGGFYSAEDADSEGEEGKFYVWDINEIREALPEDEAELFINVFNFSEEGNYSDEATGGPTGKNIPHLSKSAAELAKEYDLSVSSFKNKIDNIRKKLLKKRQKRVHPLLDDKILTDWNGLIIAALAKAGRAFQNDKYIETAEQCYEFVSNRKVDDKGNLNHRFRKGDLDGKAFADDYSFLIWGLIELYEATFETKYLKQAVELNKKFIENFWDEEEGGFYTTENGSEELLGRKKELYDGALPSANSAAMLNLLRLGRMTGNTDLEDMTDKMNRLFSHQIKKAPTGFGFALQSISFAAHSKEIIIVGHKQTDVTKEMVAVLHERFLPNAVVLLKEPADEKITKIAPFLKNFEMKDGKTTAYVCENYSCEKPVSLISKLKTKLDVLHK